MTVQDRSILRELATQVAEIAALLAANASIMEDLS